jgi:ubiquitin carboxyl-terminal hydrolase 7
MTLTISLQLRCLSKEIKPGIFEKPGLSCSQSELIDGDIVCFQVELPEKE